MLPSAETTLYKYAFGENDEMPRFSGTFHPGILQMSLELFKSEICTRIRSLSYSIQL